MSGAARRCLMVTGRRPPPPSRGQALHGRPAPLRHDRTDGNRRRHERPRLSRLCGTGSRADPRTRRHRGDGQPPAHKNAGVRAAVEAAGARIAPRSQRSLLLQHLGGGLQLRRRDVLARCLVVDERDDVLGAGGLRRFRHAATPSRFGRNCPAAVRSRLRSRAAPGTQRRPTGPIHARHPQRLER